METKEEGASENEMSIDDVMGWMKENAPKMKKMQDMVEKHFGKAADLVLVDGNPEVNIGDLRHTKVVMMDGKLMDADALRAAGGFAGKPKFED